MRYLKFFCIIMLAAVPVTSFGQESVSRSRLMGIDLTANSKRENRAAIMSMYISRLDSFAIRNNIKVDKMANELLYTDADSLFNRLNKTGWTITGISEADFYQIQRGNNKFIAYVNYDISTLPLNFVSPARKTINIPFAIAAVLLIRRR